MNSTQTKVLKYVFLPQVLPRIYRVFATGFAHVPFFMALIYRTAGLLPADHPYLNSQNMGRYGIGQVINQAANRLVFDRKHADQIFIFFVILAGVILLAMQFVLLALAVVTHHGAWAAPAALGPSQAELISQGSPYNPGPAQDLAFIMLDRVFGMKNIFNSCISTAVPCVDLRGQPLPSLGAYPTPFQLALHTLLEFYSLGIFLVSVILIIYFIITITAETAATGIPFGQRLNKTWAPIRLIIFAALLVPLNIGGDNAGLNGGQLIVMWAAKFGSNFATNAWGRFNMVLTTTYLGQTQDLIGTPNMPEMNPLAQFMFTVKACQIAENYSYGHGADGVQAYLVREEQGADAVLPGANFRALRLTDYQTAMKFTNYGPIHIRFGEQKTSTYSASAEIAGYDAYNGSVKPFCGELRIDTMDVDPGGGIASGSVAIQQLYYEMVRQMWDDPQMVDYAKCLRSRIMQDDHDPTCAGTNLWPDGNFQKTIITKYQNYLETNLPPLINQEVTNGVWNVPPNLKNKGWAGAAIWYNRIAQMNGDVANAVGSLPQPTTFPFVMETVASQQRANNESVLASSIFDPEAAKDVAIRYSRDKDQGIAAVENSAWTAWANSGSYDSHFKSEGEGVFIDFINALFGTSGLFEMRRNTNIHPLAQLSALGKSLMQAALRNYTISQALTIGGALGQETLDKFPVAMMQMVGGFLHTISLSTMAIAFTLYYILPFLPFLYFIFAVMGWVKGIFEAMVAMPLWALAHLRIDGEGMPGPAANSGYFLILEIFLRPILIVFGLLASIQIFSALVVVMNQVFDLVVQNVSGFDQQAELTGLGPSQIAYYRGSVDKFFYTLLYVAMCYMLGQGCFKLIDEIPDTILRWIGVSVSSFASQPSEDAGQLSEKGYETATIATQNLKGGQLAALLAG